MTLWLRLAAWLGQVETRHWVAMGASALLHLAVVLGFRQPSPPPPETVSFEIALQSPEEARLKVPKAKAKSSEVVDKGRPRKVAKAKQIKPKAVIKEPHTLEAAFKAEKRPQKDAPEVSLPKAETQVAEAAQASQSLPHVAQARATTGAKATASAGGAEATATGGAGPAAGGASAPSGEAGLALVAARILALAPGGGEASQGAEASTSPGSATEGAHAGTGPASFSASGSVGGGLNVAAGTGANLHSASPSVPLSGGEPQGLRLTASGSLSSQPEFAQGKGGLASGHLAMEAGAASPVEGQGRGQALASAQAGGASVSPLPGPAAGPGKGGQGAAIERPAAARQAGGAGPAPGRLAGAQVPDRSLSGPQVSKRAGGNTSQEGKTLALAPGEPGSGPQWAVPMLPVQAGVPMPPGQGRGAPDKRGGQGVDQVVTAPGGGDSVAGGTGTGAVRLAQAPGGGLASVAPRGVAGSGGGTGGRSVAPVVGPTAPGGSASAGQGRGMSSVQPAEQKIVRPDSRVETLDVLAPSNYCPLPIHAQPDNRPPQAPADRLELPSYAMNNPSFVYPVMANVYGVEGKLIMRVQVQEDGTPGQMLLKQSSGNGMLDKDAREQLTRWRFNPARKNGQAVTAWVDVPVTYRLPEGRK